MAILVGIAGLLLVLLVLWDAFETIVLPRRVTRRLRLTRLFYLFAWSLGSGLARRVPAGKRRERYLAFFGPLSLLMLLAVWASSLVLGYAMLEWSLRSPLNVPAESVSFGTYIYMSGTTLFTLGFGDITPLSHVGRLLAVLEAGTGLGFLAIVIGYLPVIYQAFSRRETNITLLDARAGSPSSAAELLRRHGDGRSTNELVELLRDWEYWSADLLESHLSYPLLSYYRSQHDNQSWLAALTTIMDTCALVIVGVDGVGRWQATLTFAIARHAIVDIAQIFNTAPHQPNPDRLPPADLARMRATLAAASIPLRDGAAADEKLAELRQMYEPYVYSLSCYLMMPLPPWVLANEVADNWRTSAWGRISAGIEAPVLAQSDDDDQHLW